MSGGDRNNPHPFTLPEAKAILRLPVVEKMMRRWIEVNADSWDIPYLAGYSKDGSKIYIDRDLSDLNYRGQSINTDRWLKLHEEVEKALIDAVADATGHDLLVLLACLRMKSPSDQIYFHTHGVATAVEEYAVEKSLGHAGLEAYNRFMGKSIKKAEDERIRKVPGDLDLTPYYGSDAQDKRLRAAMRKAMS